ncbi:MAG: hypothetical protein ACXVUE_22660 [Solirubrobacteraceae bacterium]
MPHTSSGFAAPRAEHIFSLAASLGNVPDPDGADGAINAVAHVVADACLAGDGPAIDAAAGTVRAAAGDWEGRGADGSRSDEVGWAEQRGRLYGIADVLRWVLRGRAVSASAKSVEPVSHAHRMLAALGAEGVDHLSGTDLTKRLAVDKTQVSRTGRELIDRGLVTTTALGRKTMWELTPRGRYALAQLGAVPSDDAKADAPMALVLEGMDDRGATALAAEVVGSHEGVIAFIVSPGAHDARRRGTRRAPLMLIHAPRGSRGVLASIEEDVRARRRSRVQTAAVASVGERTYSVQGAAASARRDSRSAAIDTA